MGAAYDAASAWRNAAGVSPRAYIAIVCICSAAMLGWGVRTAPEATNLSVLLEEGVHLSLFIPFCNFAKPRLYLLYFSHLPAHIRSLLCPPSIHSPCVCCSLPPSSFRNAGQGCAAELRRPQREATSDLSNPIPPPPQLPLRPPPPPNHAPTQRDRKKTERAVHTTWMK